jgi:hypothetical protein
MAGMFAATMQGGMCLAFPDTCNTPAGPVVVAIPYPNLGTLALGLGTTVKVLIMYMPVYTAGSKLPMSQGDEAGSVGGVMSGMIMGEVAFRTQSSKVSMQGQKVVVLTCMSAHNGASANAPAGAIIAPSQTVVLVGM